MIFGLLPLIGLIVLVVLVVRALLGRESRAGRGRSDGRSLRRFFQYVLLYGLLVVVAVGLSGLLDRLFDRSALVAGDRTGLALSIAFTVVGLPLLTTAALWTRRTLRGDPAEARTFGWSAYCTAASITALAVTAFAVHDLLNWAVGVTGYDSGAPARTIVWGAVWAAHWWLDRRLTPPPHTQVHHLLGSLIGLGTAAAGLGGLLSGALETAFGLGGTDVLAGDDDPILRGAVTLAVGAPVWFLYWTRTAARSERGPLWLGYVLLAGVASGLITAVVSASTACYLVLVWLVGDPGGESASRYFHDLPGAAAGAVVGVIVWWYHHAVLAEAGTGPRTEVRRIYEYLMAAIGLLAAAAGLTTILVALIEAVTGSTLIAGGGAVNTLIAAATLLLVGGPVWWLFWRRVRAAAQAAPDQEHASPTRRIYLFVLFGVAGIAAVIVLLIGVYVLVEDALSGTFGAATVRRMRFPIGILASTAAVCGYHWAIYRAEREVPAVVAGGPHYVLLVGPQDPELARAVARRTGGRVQAWPRTDRAAAPWSVEEVLATLDGSTADEVIVLSDGDGLQLIPVHRA